MAVKRWSDDLAECSSCRYHLSDRPSVRGAWSTTSAISLIWSSSGVLLPKMIWPAISPKRSTVARQILASQSLWSCC
jgi:hypothetical protein